MRVGTKSVLFGAHAFWLHPFILALAWWRLYGFPSDPRLWVAFFVHDLGYWGKPNMDGRLGQSHPFWAARLMGRLFDRGKPPCWYAYPLCNCGGHNTRAPATRWSKFVLFHSRFLAKQWAVKPSRLCVADKMVIAIEPWWLYLPRVWLSGELALYRQTSSERREGPHDDPSLSAKDWWAGLQAYMQEWVDANRDGGPDTMTPSQEGA